MPDSDPAVASASHSDHQRPWASTTPRAPLTLEPTHTSLASSRRKLDPSGAHTSCIMAPPSPRPGFPGLSHAHTTTPKRLSQPPHTPLPAHHPPAPRSTHSNTCRAGLTHLRPCRKPLPRNVASFGCGEGVFCRSGRQARQCGAAGVPPRNTERNTERHTSKPLQAPRTPTHYTHLSWALGGSRSASEEVPEGVPVRTERSTFRPP